MDEMIQGAAPQDTVQQEQIVKPINSERLLELTQILRKYKTGKAHTESRIIASEEWWKLRNAAREIDQSKTMAQPGHKSTSGWLHNVIVSKHADAMRAYPEANILPREKGDQDEADILSSIIPCILEQNHFERKYSDVNWQKNKTGTGVYKVFWDKNKLNGLGDIAIEKANLLNVFWEPGITDIQASRYVFHTELVDKDVLEEKYPQLKDKLKGDTITISKFLYDDKVDTANKATVVEVYYHKRGKLHYIKYVCDEVLFATENDPDMSRTGLYDHGKFPYVFDPLFPIEGSPCGYGYVDLSQNPQTTIDLLNTAFIKNAMAGASPRYFVRQDGGINEDEFLDTTKALVHVAGNINEEALRPIDTKALPTVYVGFLDRVIQELRETSGNTETATGSVSGGVTAASAIAALQEASGKGSEDASLSAYRAFSDVVNLCIELIRQFYSLPRQFRIVGDRGKYKFISYTNASLQPQAQGSDFGQDMGYRLPVFDIKVSAQKASVYTRVSQNELALQFYQLGFFNPQMADQALMCLEIMDFDGKDAITQKIAEQGTMAQKLNQYMQLSLEFANQFAPEMVQGIAGDVMQTLGAQPQRAGAAPQALLDDNHMRGAGGKEPAIVENARARASDVSQPEGGKVIRERG